MSRMMVFDSEMSGESKHLRLRRKKRNKETLKLLCALFNLSILFCHIIQFRVNCVQIVFIVSLKFLLMPIQYKLCSVYWILFVRYGDQKVYFFLFFFSFFHIANLTSTFAFYASFFSLAKNFLFKEFICYEFWIELFLE